MITKKYKRSTSKSKTKSKSKSKTNKKNTLNYCCPDKKNKTQCAQINTDLNTSLNLDSTNTKPNYAITTLLFGGDSYLPGILLLGSSIRKSMPKPYEKYITLCCMITNDVSTEARELILKIYDRVIEVDYLQIPPKLIKHKNPNTQTIYSKTFTKLRIFDMTEYDKVLFLDSDMLVLKKDFFSLFNLNTPACVFLGKLSNNPQDRYFKEFKENGRLFKQFQNKYCHWQNNNRRKSGPEHILHGNLIPYNKKYENENTSNGMNIETSVLLIKPSKSIMNAIIKYVENIKQKQIKMSGDTEMVSRFFKDKLYAIEPRFFGRWVNPEEHPELVVLDLYGSDGKPWDTTKFKELIKYIDVGDVSYWWKIYMSVYEKEYKSWNNTMLDTLYEKITKFLKKT
jgi:alpha-N-acetylglucosamine transferase